MKDKRRIIGVIGFLGILILAISMVWIFYMKKESSKITTPTKENTTEQNTAEETIATWAVYWDMKDLQEEMQEAADSVETVVLFAAYFQEDDQLLLPDVVKEFGNLYVERHPNIDYYISVVNDRVQNEGPSILKEKELLERLYQDETTMNLHIQSIIELAKSLDVQGIEIDYEGFRYDVDLWQKHLLFCEQLAGEAKEHGLKVRVLVEPGIKFDQLSFPNGVEYVVMAYNLYGVHSGPGPKADIKFLNNLLQKMEHLSDQKGIAFATGGFLWTDEKDAVGVTQVEAERLAKEHGATVLRDEGSYVNYFQYQGENGQEQEVWYADRRTLENWIAIAKQEGIQNISIWRMEEQDTK